MNYKIVIVFALLLSFVNAKGQELNLDIKVSAPKLRLVDPKVFKTLEISINEFFNNTQWTEDEFEVLEKIEGSLTLNILEEINAKDFQGEIRIQALRPVYGSNYKSPLLNIVDKAVIFSYTEYQPIENSLNSYVDNLSSILTYYAQLILAYDYDSFESLGGEPYFNNAQNVINLLPTGLANGDDGWKKTGIDRNRYKLVENALNPRIKNLRAAMYEYHRKSLDAMHEDAGLSLAIMQSSLNTLNDTEDTYPNSYYVQSLADTKREEIVEVFKGADKGMQTKVYNIMVNIDPSQATLYGQILKR